MISYEPFTNTTYPHEVPPTWNCLFYSDDMEEIVNCPSCGKELPYGRTLTSLEIFEGGFGCGVCGECYQKERYRKTAALKVE